MSAYCLDCKVRTVKTPSGALVIRHLPDCSNEGPDAAAKPGRPWRVATPVSLGDFGTTVGGYPG